MADRRGSHSVGFGRAMEEPVAVGVESHLVGEVSESLDVDPLDLEASLILDP